MTVAIPVVKAAACLREGDRVLVTESGGNPVSAFIGFYAEVGAVESVGERAEKVLVRFLNCDSAVFSCSTLVLVEGDAL